MAAEVGPKGAPGEGVGGIRRRRNRSQHTRRPLSTGAGAGAGAEQGSLAGLGGYGWRIGLLIGVFAALMRPAEVRVDTVAPACI